ncbi:MAG: DNA-binding response regulator [Myxococcales bacterium]|nr:DNA-binding response regulator [Myxococcales bacterium]
MSGYHVLLIDDDTRLHELLTSYLEGNGFKVSCAANGEQGLEALKRGDFDAALVDIMMPGMDGLEVLRRVRSQRSPLPVIMLTARGDDTDRIVGLELGADDYVPKPFNPRELLARLRAVLCRSGPGIVSERIEVQNLEIDLGTREVTRDGDEVTLTGLEFDILVALARRAGRVVTRDGLLAAAGRDDVFVGDRTVDVHISHLRQKLADDPRSPTLIKTVRGAGYMMARGSS